MVKQFVILPSDRDWLTICRSMAAKGMPVEVQGDECVIYAWHQGYSIDVVLFMEFAEPGDPIPKGWIRPDERDPAARKRQRETEHADLMANMETYEPR
jgi:hypothetical protein